MEMADAEMRHDDSVSALPDSEKDEETWPENRLETDTNKHERDERIGLDENARTPGTEAYHHSPVQSIPSEIPTSSAVATTCSKTVVYHKHSNITETDVGRSNNSDHAASPVNNAGQVIAAPSTDEFRRGSSSMNSPPMMDHANGRLDNGNYYYAALQQHIPSSMTTGNVVPPNFYPYGPYFANPFMAPFVAHHPQAQNDDIYEPTVSQSHRASLDVAASPLTFYNADLVAHAKYYRGMLQQYLRNLEASSVSTTDSASLKEEFEHGETMEVKLDNHQMMPNSDNDAGVDMNANFNDRHEIEAATISSNLDNDFLHHQNAAHEQSVEDNSTIGGRDADRSMQSLNGNHSKSGSSEQTTSTHDDNDTGKDNDSENQAMALIKKQVLEIEKQILRNAQNQNTRKMDPKEVEAFLLESQVAASAAMFDANWAMRNGACGQLEQDDSTRHAAGFGPKPIRSSNEMPFIPGHPSASYAHPDQYYGPSPPPCVYPSAPMSWQPNFFYPAPPSVTQFHGSTPSTGFIPANGYDPRLQIYNATVAGFPYYAMPQRQSYSAYSESRDTPNGVLEAQNREVQVQPTQSMKIGQNAIATGDITETSSSSSTLSSLGGTPFKSVENQRKLKVAFDSASIDSIGSCRETHEGDSKRWSSSAQELGRPPRASDEEEPVWVLRESYVRKIKREEERKAQRERNEAMRMQQENLATADKTLAEADYAETDQLLEAAHHPDLQKQNGTSVTEQAKQIQKKPRKKKEVMVHEPAVLIEGVLFRARYLGSTQLACDGRPTKGTRMVQAQEAVGRIKAPEGERQPFTDVDLFISTEKIMVLNTDLQDIMMDHPLRTISYIADIGDLVVLMARRVSQASQDSPEPMAKRTPRIMCHVFESDEAQFIAQSIGQAFQVAYMEFLRANGIEDTSCMRDVDYQEVLNSQEMFEEELEMFARKETERDVIIPKQKNEILGVVVVESGWGSMLPTAIIASMMPGGPAARSNQLNIGDHIITINGISLVGLPLSDCQNHVRNVRHLTAVKLTAVRTPPVVEVRMRRPDTKYQLGFSVQNGVICSLLRGGIGERGGVRVGHRIIEINSQSVVAVPHETIVTILASAIGEIQMKTMPTSMYRLLTGQETPNYL